MKRLRQKNLEEEPEQETPTRRGQRLRKPTAKVMENLSSSAAPSTSTETNKRRKVSLRFGEDSSAVELEKTTSDLNLLSEPLGKTLDSQENAVQNSSVRADSMQPHDLLSLNAAVKDKDETPYIDNKKVFHIDVRLPEEVSNSPASSFQLSSPVLSTEQTSQINSVSNVSECDTTHAFPSAQQSEINLTQVRSSSVFSNTAEEENLGQSGKEISVYHVNNSEVRNDVGDILMTETATHQSTRTASINNQEEEMVLSLQQDETSQNAEEVQLDVAETFITIETKDGLSSEKIPFSQFLKKVVIDKESGNLKLDLGQLLLSSASTGCSVTSEKGDVRSSQASTSASTSSQCVVEGKPTSSNIQPTLPSVTGKTQVSASDKPVKRRGRPPKHKQAHLSSLPFGGSTVTQGKFSENILKPAAFVELPVESSQVTEKQDFIQSPRRSRRTPAKNSRFGDDFVDSITLGKVASSSSTWNTQLMTLALAAERHKGKAQKPSVNELDENEEYELSEDFDAHDEDSDYSPKETPDMEASQDHIKPRKKAEEAMMHTEHKRFISVRNVNLSTASNEQARKTTSTGLRGPKTKKYEPVDPVVKRSLEEAFTHNTEALKGHLNATMSQPDENESNGAAYFTIMEPKMEASGHGLLINKSDDGMSFQIINFDGNRPSGSTLFSISKSYPQDRYFSCHMCEKIFPSSNTWLQHNKYTHNRAIDTFENTSGYPADRTEHKCEFCGQKFPFKFMLDIHIKRKRHSEVKSFRCTLCKESFMTHKDREEHWMMSHPARSCGLCGKQFTNIVMLRRHINHNCHGARFRIRNEADSGETNAEDKMVVNDYSRALEKEMNDENGSDHDDLDEAVKETDAEEGDIDNEDDTLDSNGVRNESGKVRCDRCENEFSTYSGLWYHKLDEHHEFYPQGYKDRLQEKLDKNQNTLQNAQDTNTHRVDDSSKNKFFVLLKPKWPPSKSKLTISVDDKEFTFKPRSEMVNKHGTLPQNSYADVPSKKETTFECSQCGEIFQFASNYREHRSRVHGECFEVLRLLGAFQCTLCSETYPCQFMLDRHLKKHVGKKLLPCTLCGLYFHKIQERRLHWKTAHPGIGCPNCGKMYASIKYLQKHISLNCQDHFPPTKKFLEFQKRQHSDFEMSKSEKKVEKKIIQCHLCPKLCSSVHGWRRHMSESHEDAGFSKLSNTCIICNELVYGYKALEKHLLENHAVESGLPVEEEDGIVEEALKKCEMDITAYRKAGKNSTEIYQDEEGNYHCPSCPKTHPHLRALRTHIRIHVNMKLECSICNKTFKNPTLLKQHVQRHRKDAVYTCDTCNKKFLTLQKLNKHRKVHHSPGNFVCELCGMSFALNDYLQKHKRCHTDKRPHCCTICGKTFRTKPELRVHVLIHTRETPYKCQYCNRGFSQKGNYRIHLAQHTGEKPYQCDQCEISFALLCHLKRHKVTHDQKINYRCVWCDKECTQRKHMQMHVQRVHKEDFYQFEEQMKLETPVPIAPSQAKLYNRRIGKMNKVRKQYRTRAQKCDSTIQQLMNGVVTKSEPMDEDTETSQNIVIDPIVEPMVETVTSDMAVTSHENGAFEILVSEDHQNYAKHSIPPELIGQDPSNVEIVMGENNEINIIIKDSSALQEVVSGQADLAQLSGSSVHVHESLQQAVEAFVVTHTKGIGEEDSQTHLGIDELDKTVSEGASQLSTFDAPSAE